MQLQLTDNELNEQIQKALILSLSEEAKTKMIGDALAWLTTPDRSTYSSKKSPLQIAVESAVSYTAGQLIAAEFSNPDSEASRLLSDLVVNALSKMRDAQSYSNLSEKFAAALASAIGANL